MTHLNYEILASYIENNLDFVEREGVEKHLAQPCLQCGAKLARLRSVFEVAAADKTAAPPADVLTRAVVLYKKPSSNPVQSILRVFAHLQFDSRLQMSSLPTRGAARSRQMLFTAEQVDIDLQITPDNGEHSLMGQVLSSAEDAESSSAFVCLQQESGMLVRGVETDALGQFAFKEVPSGIYDLVFELGNQEVTIKSLEIVNDQG